MRFQSADIQIKKCLIEAYRQLTVPFPILTFKKLHNDKEGNSTKPPKGKKKGWQHRSFTRKSHSLSTSQLISLILGARQLLKGNVSLVAQKYSQKEHISHFLQSRKRWSFCLIDRFCHFDFVLYQYSNFDCIYFFFLIILLITSKLLQIIYQMAL